MYWIKRKVWQIKNVIKWLPTIWNQYDFDYGYSINVFRFQLEKQADFLESDKACTMSANYNAKRIRTTLRLMKKVYDEDYAMEYHAKLEDIYGEELMELGITDIYLKHNYELTESPELIKEIDNLKDKLFTESNLKQEKAHRILWLMVERNIQGWWD